MRARVAIVFVALLVGGGLGLGIGAGGGCGFLPEGDFTGRRVGDGIAPWTDLGPVQICLGNQFLDGPQTTPGGLCFNSDVTETLCASDAECRSRETCACGRCTIAYCAASSDCSDGRICTFGEHRCDRACADVADCADGEECFNGTCRGRCQGDGDCQTGEVCSSRNYCTTADCSEDADCLDGERCRVQRIPRQLLEPSVLAASKGSEPRVTVWIDLADPATPGQREIWRVVSSDGRTFRTDPARPVLDDGADVRAPSVIRTSAGVVMYYEWDDGAELRVATSLDGGASFGEPVTALVGGTGGAATRAPSAVLMPDGTVAVYYQVGDGVAIALATGAPGGALQVRGPVLTPADVTDPPTGAAGDAFWADVEAIGSPMAALTASADGPSLRLWFAAFGRESADAFRFGEVIQIPPNYSIGYAATSVDAPDELTVWPFNPIIDRVTEFLVHHSELGPGAVQLTTADGTLDDAYLMYYVDAAVETAGGPFTIGRLGVLGNGAFTILE